ncbi:hypothetical protein KFL_011080030 [Klebsormidium nitens]|uniref:Uncharacterized protein n=1 Tax=Klebsormidium nitens TaxID=105231 RepID=A0A1Y1IPE0_KLENI|nr:hypothetical protein KFL_011080030 [Klebsormidium nitens]|eukprot:GAQ92720.1 hypothetical protein KFL_011080030 [Klebsormidium nitens]
MTWRPGVQRCPWLEMTRRHLVFRVTIIVFVLAALLWSTFLTQRTIKVTQNILRLLRKRQGRPEPKKLHIVTVQGGGTGIGFQQLPG